MPCEGSCEAVAVSVRAEAGSRRSGDENGIYARDEGRVYSNVKAPEIRMDSRSCGIGAGRCGSCIALVDSQSAGPDNSKYQIDSADH